MTFNENDVNRQDDGRFDYKVGSAPSFALPDQEVSYVSLPGLGAWPVGQPVALPYSPPPAAVSIHSYEDAGYAGGRYNTPYAPAAEDPYYSERREGLDFVSRLQTRLTLWRGGIDKRYTRDADDAVSYGHKMDGNIVNPRAAVLGAVIENELHRRRGNIRSFAGGNIQQAQEKMGVLDTKAGAKRTFEEVHLIATAATDINDPRAAQSEEMYDSLNTLYKTWFDTDVSAEAVARSVRENGVQGTTELLSR